MKKIIVEPFDNYFLLNYYSQNELVVPNSKEPLTLVGRRISNRKSDSKVTIVKAPNVTYRKSLSGKEYTYFEGHSLIFKNPLLNKHPDYVEYLSLKKINYPILTNWNLRLKDDSYILTGECEDYLVEGTVTNQYGNYITLDGVENFYVEWISISDAANCLLKGTGKLADFSKKDFDYYLYDQIRPNFNLSDRLA